MSTVLLAIIVVGLSILFTVGLVTLARVSQRGRAIMKGTSDIEGIYIVVVGTIYAIFLAFMIFVIWSRYYEADETTEREANAAATLYRLSGNLPKPLQNQYKNLCIEYANTMIHREWSDMAHNRKPYMGNRMVDKIWLLTNKLEPENIKEQVIYDHITNTVTQLTELRQLRLLQSETSLPGILQAVLILGAVVVVGLACIFTVDEFWLHVIKAAILAAMISFMLLVIWTLDRPFQGSVYVNPAPFEHTLSVAGYK